ncbi:unnamed protein product [Gongylonema pulchrum]|uniref:Uncharacterized protein n=1 Tax=Gongylonema pulchrum TaxID=637853 RepID=A0A3P7RU93_9BILA|nr:unnamed protein product [Gongylonema pulchrum]
MYRKMHKRIAVQTLRMKELGRLKKPEDAKETVEIPSKNELPKLKRKIQEESDQSPKVCEQKVKVEKPSRSIQQKRSAILLPQSPVVLAKRPRNFWSEREN